MGQDFWTAAETREFWRVVADCETKAEAIPAVRDIRSFTDLRRYWAAHIRLRRSLLRAARLSSRMTT